MALQIRQAAERWVLDSLLQGLDVDLHFARVIVLRRSGQDNFSDYRRGWTRQSKSIQYTG